MTYLAGDVRAQLQRPLWCRLARLAVNHSLVRVVPGDHMSDARPGTVRPVAFSRVSVFPLMLPPRRRKRTVPWTPFQSATSNVTP